MTMIESKTSRMSRRVADLVTILVALFVIIVCDSILVADAASNIFAASISSTSKTCITTVQELRLAIRDASISSSNVTEVRLCSRNIDVAPPTSSKLGIDLSNKILSVKCVLPSSLTKCVLDGKNKAPIFYGNNVTLNVENIEFANGLVDDSGGAMQFIQNSKIIIGPGCTFRNNKAITGGAIYISQDSSITLRGSNSNGGAITFVDNKADYGAAAYIVDNSVLKSNGRVLFYNNKGDFVLEGAKKSQVSLIGSKIFNNKAGAIQLTGSSKATFDQIEIYSNVANKGAGIFLYNAFDVNITRSSFYDNVAKQEGGALYINANYALVTLNGVLFRNNSARDGGSAIAIGNSEVNITNSVITRNSKSSAIISILGNIIIRGSRFIYNQRRSITNIFSKIILSNTTFFADEAYKNVSGYNILNQHKAGFGNDYDFFVSCGAQTVFCNGLGIYDDKKSKYTTNCNKDGIRGKLGVRPCIA